MRLQLKLKLTMDFVLIKKRKVNPHQCCQQSVSNIPRKSQMEPELQFHHRRRVKDLAEEGQTKNQILEKIKELHFFHESSLWEYSYHFCWNFQKNILLYHFVEIFQWEANRIKHQKSKELRLF